MMLTRLGPRLRLPLETVEAETLRLSKKAEDAIDAAIEQLKGAAG